MSAPHFLLSSLDADPLTLPREASHHAVRALRMRAGEAITATDGRGGLVRGLVGDPDPTALRIDLRERVLVPQRTPRLTIAFALTKGAKPEFVVEKLTEIGVQRIVPWSAKHSVVRWDESKRKANGERFRAVAISALEQSRRAWLPEVLDPLPCLDDLLQTTDDHILVCDASSSRRLPNTLEGSTTIVIGPEGGLDDEELDRLKKVGATAVTIADAILRAETAAIVAAALAMDRLGPPA